jgi:hypothetical protein
METKMEKGEPIEVWFFGDSAVTGTVENVDKVTATIVIGKIFGGLVSHRSSHLDSQARGSAVSRTRLDRIGPLLGFCRIILLVSGAFGPE